MSCISDFKSKVFFRIFFWHKQKFPGIRNRDSFALGGIQDLTLPCLLFTDVYILMFVFGQLVDIIKEIFQKGRARFWSYHWNYLIVATVMLFCLGHIIWWIGYATLPDAFRSMTLEDNAVKRSYTIMLSSESFISLGILFAFVQNFSFFQVNASVGPLLSAFSQMLIDVGKFFLYFAFIFVAFAASFTKLYIQYNAAKEYFALGAVEENPQKLQR